ncbi:MAG: histidine--tRNA ligase [Pseudomonadota bacterium]
MADTKKFSAVKGMADVLPPVSSLWQEIESTARRVFDKYGYHEIRTPIVEPSELFRRGVGESTSIVEKEMYSFVDQGGDSLSLRPEGTASVVRAYIESGACISDPIARYYYMGPMFRRERPQKGRQRQFYQIGCEILGVESPVADAETIAMTSHFLGEVGARDVALEINSIGCADCRPSFNEALVVFLTARAAHLCEDCTRRLSRNPSRVFDCKQENCRKILKDAPKISDHWCEACRGHFSAVKRALDGMSVPYVENVRIVRGLDYYVRTAFEFTSKALGSQSAVVGGGRYDGLVKSLGGPEIAGVGFALGIERLVLLLEGAGKKPPFEDIIFFAVLGEAAQAAAIPIVQTLRRDGVRVEWDYGARSLKAQMRRASRIGAETVVILGDDEVAKGTATIRDMRASTQREVHIKDIPMHFVRTGD